MSGGGGELEPQEGVERKTCPVDSKILPVPPTNVVPLCLGGIKITTISVTHTHCCY